MKNKLYLLMAGLVLAALMAACAPAPAATTEPTEEMTEVMTEAPTEEMTEEVTEVPTEEPTEAPVEMGTEDNPIVFSFVPSSDASKVIDSATALTDALSEATGLVIKANVPIDYVSAIEAMCSGEAQMGALATFAYVVASGRGCADVALVSERNGATTYQAQLITAADSGITEITDLKGKTFCRPDAISTSGWIIPSIALKAAGVDPDTDLAEVIDAGGHDGVVRSVYNGDCDAGATFVDARTTVQEELTDVMDKVVVIATSSDIPNDSIAFAADVPDEIRAKIVTALLDMNQNEDQLKMMQDLYRWAGLVEVDDTFYDEFRQLLQVAGVNVEDYIK